jgi:hypothetical protein
MITLILARYGLHIGAAAGIIVAFLAWDASRVHKGVQKERARVERQGAKTDAKAQEARRAATAQHDKRLQQYYRD